MSNSMLLIIRKKNVSMEFGIKITTLPSKLQPKWHEKNFQLLKEKKSFGRYLQIDFE